MTSTTNEESNNLKNNPKNIEKQSQKHQSINEEFTKIENNEVHHNHNESLSENSTKEIKVTNNNNPSGASPKLLSDEEKTNSSTKKYKHNEKPLDDSLVTGDCQYFFEDEIFRIDKKGRVKFGLVLETPGTYSGDEDDEFDEILEKDEIRVVWYPEFEETVQSENSV